MSLKCTSAIGRNWLVESGTRSCARSASFGSAGNDRKRLIEMLTLFSERGCPWRSLRFAITALVVGLLDSKIYELPIQGCPRY